MTTTINQQKTFLLAPDSFKGSLTAQQFCQIASQSIQAVQPMAQVMSYPMSDGGEGFVDSFAYAQVGQTQSLWVANPVGKKIKANYQWIEDSATAIIEMAQASGLPSLTKESLNPANTFTTGTGQLIQAAIAKGAKKIILGLGGSATNDGGVGALMALGIEFLNAKGKSIPLGGQGLKDLVRIGSVPQSLLEIEWVIASDVNNPLLGENGATMIFGPQKGGQPHQLEQLEAGMGHYAEILQQHSKKAVAQVPGAGAAGGMAAGFIALLNASITPGFKVIQELMQLDQVLAEQAVDYIITGEGRFDSQTRFGKLPLQIAQLGQKHQVPTIGVCGSLTCAVEDLPEFTAIFSLCNRVMTEPEAMHQAPYLLQQTLASVTRLIST